MKPLFHFLVEPLGGKRYDNELNLASGKKITLSVSQEDYTVTQRIAVIRELPIDYTGPVKKGDMAVVHHNVFRKSFDQKGREKSGSGDIGNGMYLVDPELIYMHKSFNQDEWKSVGPFIFISPISNDDKIFDSSRLKQLYGIIEYSADSRLTRGSLVSFTPESEYEFKIDSKLMYRMYEKNITLIEYSCPKV